MAKPPLVRMRVLGSTEIEDRQGMPLRSIFSQPKRFALLIYLALAAPGGFHRRDSLLALLWPELDTAGARNALRKALHFLRQALAPEVLVGRGDGEIGIEPGLLWCDASAFGALLQAGRPDEALGLYRGDLLPGFFISEAPEFEQWLEGERARLRRQAAAAAWRVAERAEARREPEAVEWARRAVALAADDERALRRLLSLMDRLGDRAGAIRAYEEFCRHLAAEYALEPSPETRALVTAIRARTGDSGVEAVEPPLPAVRVDAAVAARGAEPWATAVGVTIAAAPTIVAGAATPPRLADEPDPARGVMRGRWMPVRAVAGVVLATALVLVALTAAGNRWLVLRRDATATHAPIRSLAVLPLENLSPDSAQQYFADGMTDALITALSRQEQLRIIAQAAVMGYRGTGKTPTLIGRELRVDAVVEGTVLRDGDRVRISARLIDTRTAHPVWTGEYEGELRDILELQREVSSAVARGVRIALSPEDEAGAAALRSIDPEAYDYYLRGSYFRQQVRAGAPELAVELLERAVALEPEFAAAHAELALAYAYIVSNFNPERTELMDKGFIAAARALALDPRQATAHVARGRLLWTAAHGFPHTRAISEFARAVELDPNSYEGRFHLAQTLVHIGLFDETLAEIERASAINPVDPRPRVTAGQVLMYRQQPAAALAVLRETPADHNPMHRGPYLAWALASLGRQAEAEAALADALARAPEDGNGTISSLQAVFAAAAGDVAMAEERIRTALTKRRGSNHFHHSMYRIASAYALLGRNVEALKWLRAAAEEGFPCYPLFASDPNLDALRADPGFLALLGELREQHAAYRALLGL